MLSRPILQSTLQLGWYEQMMLDLAVEMAILRLVEEFGRDFVILQKKTYTPQATRN
jgi:hypothetical protein